MPSPVHFQQRLRPANNRIELTDCDLRACTGRVALVAAFVLAGNHRVWLVAVALARVAGFLD